MAAVDSDQDGPSGGKTSREFSESRGRASPVSVFSFSDRHLSSLGRPVNGAIQSSAKFPTRLLDASSGPPLLLNGGTQSPEAGRVAAFQSSFLKSPTIQLTSSQRLPVTKTLTVSSKTSSFPSSSFSMTSTTPSSSRHQPVASLNIDPYHLIDVEVQLKPSCHDIMLQGKVGVVTKISGRTATVQIRDNSSDITIPHDSLKPVPVRPSDTVKVIGGSDSILGFVGTLVSVIGNDGVVQFVSTNRQRKRNPAQIPLGQLGRYSPKSKFPLGLPLSLNLFPSKSSSMPNTSLSASSPSRPSVVANSLGVRNSTIGTLGGTLGATTAQQVMVPVCLYAAVPNQEKREVIRFTTRPSNPFLASSGGVSFPVTSTMMSMSHPSSSGSGRTLNLTQFRLHGNKNPSLLLGAPVESESPDSTTILREGTERDSIHARPKTILVPNSLFGLQKVPDLPVRRVSPHQTVDRPTGQLFPFPLNPKNTVPNPGLFFLGPGSRPVARGEVASSSSTGYSIKEVLERLVKYQRKYTYELTPTSPTTPGSSSDIKTSCVRVSLVCPLSLQRMKYPSRGKSCKHLQCFDAENYINFHEKQKVRKKVKHMGHYTKPSLDKKWNCPICEKITFIPQLYVDKDLMKLVRESDATEVELSKNGSWIPVEKPAQVEVIDLTDD